ncbi:MAG: ferritin-like fold-containing protein [Actinomycetes bacterium]
MSTSAEAKAPSLDRGIVELSAAVAYGELAGFFRMTSDAQLAPSISASASLARLANIEFNHYLVLSDFLARHGVDVEGEMAKFVPAFEIFHERTTPSDWFECLVKAYVGDSIAVDFYREIAGSLDEELGAIIREVANSDEHMDFLVTTLASAIFDDPKLGGRLALWARRLVGEALAQAQGLALEHQGLFDLFATIDIALVFKKLTENHTHRMQRLGLAP